MDRETRNEIERYCALAEPKETPEIFVDIKPNTVRPLDDKETKLRHQLHNPVKARDTAVQSNVPRTRAIIKARSGATDRRKLC